MFVFPYLPRKPCFCSRYVRFQLLACFRRQDYRRVFLGHARTRGGGGGGGGGGVSPGLVGSYAFSPFYQSGNMAWN